jgi:phosphoglycerate-specific signal transduction histidine kinase
LLALIAPTAIAGSLVLGQFSTGSLRERQERDALRQAVNAQMLSDGTREIARVSGSVLRLRAHNHDAGNTLSSTLINAELLIAELERPQTEGTSSAEVLALTRDLWEGLKILKSLLETAREVGIEEQLVFQTVALDRTVRRVAAFIGARHASASIEVHADAELADAQVSIAGGETSLDRMLNNLVINAVQGDGSTGARRVEIAIRRASAAQVAIVVTDDGPGFSRAQLDAQLSGFTTTKATGTGLGLYTTERLVRASRGSLHRANGANGGAVVALQLNLASDEKSESPPSSEPVDSPRVLSDAEQTPAVVR